MLKTQIDTNEAIINLFNEVENKHSIKMRRNKRTKFTLEEKIQFAIQYYNIMGDTSLLDLLIHAYKNDSELKKAIIPFICRFNILKPYPDTYAECNIDFSQQELNENRIRMLGLDNIVKEYNHQNWLELFDEDAIFKETKTKRPSYHIYLNNLGQPIKFDKPKATQIKMAIVNQCIVPARCIVEGAYPHVAKDTFPEYIAKLQKQKTLKGGK